MNFCTRVKDELCHPKFNKKSCCADAFLTGVLLFSQSFTREKVVLSSDCLTLQERTTSTLKRLTGIEASEISEHKRSDRTFYKMTLTGPAVSELYDGAMSMPLSLEEGALERVCDRTSFLRGAF